jgi:two-component system LytT family response regulator
MKKIKCILVDDEPLAVQLLENYILKTPFLELLGTFESAISAKEYLSNHAVNLVFLDIQMPDLNGLDFSAQIDPQTRIIFTTAFEEYALSGFKANALDYLLKPFNYDEFNKAAMKAKEWFELVRKGDDLDADNLLFIKSGYNNIQIKLSDIHYFQGFKDYIKIFMKDSKNPILTLMTMKSMMDNLPEDKFIRVHRSFIIPVDRIRSADKSSVMVDDAKIPLSDSYKDAFNDFIATRFIK